MQVRIWHLILLSVQCLVDPFPAWEVWGVTILPPSELGEGLNPEVAEGVERLCRKLDELIEETISKK